MARLSEGNTMGLFGKRRQSGDASRTTTVRDVLTTLSDACGLDGELRAQLIETIGSANVTDMLKFDADGLARFLDVADHNLTNVYQTADVLLRVLKSYTQQGQAPTPEPPQPAQTAPAPASHPAPNIKDEAGFRRLLADYATAAVNIAASSVTFGKGDVVASIRAIAGSVHLTDCIVLGDVTTSAGSVHVDGVCIVLGNVRTNAGSIKGKGTLYLLPGKQATTSAGDLSVKVLNRPVPVLAKLAADHGLLPKT